MDKSPEAATMDRQERAIRTAIVEPYIAQKALYDPAGSEAAAEVDPVLLFGLTRQQLRPIYAKPAGKLALSKALEQRKVVQPNGTSSYEFVRKTPGEEVDKRIQAVLWPKQHSILAAVHSVIPKRSRSTTLVLATLRHTWARLAALENEHKESESPLTLAGFICEIWEPKMLPPKVIKPLKPPKPPKSNVVWRKPS